MLPRLAQRHLSDPLLWGREGCALIPNAWGLIEGSDNPKFGKNLAQVFLCSPPRR